MAWTTVTRKRRTGHAWNGQHELAKTLLKAFLGSETRAKQKEWVCKTCGTSNFMTRKICRNCSPVQTTPPAPAPVAPASPGPPKLAPWAKARAAATRATALEAALSAARATGGDENLVRDLESKLVAAQKASSDRRPLVDKLAGCRAYISRAQRRYELAEAAASEAIKQRDAIAKDLEEHQKELAKLESETDSIDAAAVLVDKGEVAVVGSARALLDTLETSWLCDAHGALPEPLLDKIQGLRAALDTEAPQPELVMTLDNGSSEMRRSITAEPRAEELGEEQAELADEDMDAEAEQLVKKLKSAHEASGSQDEADDAAKQLLKVALTSFVKGSGKGKMQQRYEPHRVA